MKAVSEMAAVSVARVAAIVIDVFAFIRRLVTKRTHGFCRSMIKINTRSKGFGRQVKPQDNEH